MPVITSVDGSGVARVTLDGHSPHDQVLNVLYADDTHSKQQRFRRLRNVGKKFVQLVLDAVFELLLCKCLEMLPKSVNFV